MKLDACDDKPRSAEGCPPADCVAGRPAGPPCFPLATSISIRIPIWQVAARIPNWEDIKPKEAVKGRGIRLNLSNPSTGKGFKPKAFIAQMATGEGKSIVRRAAAAAASPRHAWLRPLCTPCTLHHLEKSSTP